MNQDIQRLNVKCNDCDILMDEGHSVTWYQAYAYQSRWFPGQARLNRIFKIIRVNWKAGLPIEIYRCPKCGLLKSYAVKRHDQPVV